jgi:hypothetical protein
LGFLFSSYPSIRLKHQNKSEVTSFQGDSPVFTGMSRRMGGKKTIRNLQ